VVDISPRAKLEEINRTVRYFEHLHDHITAKDKRARSLGARKRLKSGEMYPILLILRLTRNVSK
jgi:hypothetical protein